jgi:hypothetical protein
VRSIRSKWLMCVLSLAVNLGGGPMAWAQLAGAHGSHDASPTAMPMPADCAEHVRTDHSKPAHPMPCCDTGSCECAAPPAPPAMTLEAPADLRHDTFLAPPVARLVSPDPLDDTLRPPIR